MSAPAHNKQPLPHSDRFQRSLFEFWAEPDCDRIASDSIRSLDPARWAHLCRYLGNLTPKEFKRSEKRHYSDPDSLESRLKRLFYFDQAECKDLPLVHFGPLGKNSNEFWHTSY